MGDNLARKERFVGLFLSIAILLAYSAFRTRNHYWDGIGFALAIEDSPGLTPLLFNPNHLLYSFFGYLIYQPIHHLAPNIRALTILSNINTILSAFAAYLLFVMLMSKLRNFYYSTWLTLLFAFSATWWKFSTDANAYVPSTFLLLLAMYKLEQTTKPNLVSIGLIHGLSMLLHQIAVFFYPVVLCALFLGPSQRALKPALRKALVYTIVAAGTVILAYSWVWFRVLKGTSFQAFTNWVLSHGREEFAFVSLTHNVLETVRASIRVFFGGRFSLAFTHVETPLLVILGILLLCTLSVLAFTLRRAFRNFATWWKSTEPAGSSLDRMTPLLFVWIGSFWAFLFLWLTPYPYYRLFYLPGLILLLGLLLKRHLEPCKGGHSHVLASFVVTMMLANFTFLIYPYSKAEASPPGNVAIKANKIFQDDVIYFADFTCDNWIFKYFNKRTSWRPLHRKDLEAFRDELLYLKSQGKKTWIDITALDQLTKTQESAAWFEQRVNVTATVGLIDRKHRIKFSLVTPTP